jgi:hypothetical protein
MMGWLAKYQIHGLFNVWLIAYQIDQKAPLK